MLHMASLINNESVIFDSNMSWTFLGVVNILKKKSLN